MGWIWIVISPIQMPVGLSARSWVFLIDAILIGMNARYDPMKNHSGFIQAAGKLVRSGLDVHFLLAGQDVDPGNSVLAKLIGRENLAGRVHLLGRCEDIPRA